MEQAIKGFGVGNVCHLKATLKKSSGKKYQERKCPLDKMRYTQVAHNSSFVITHCFTLLVFHLIVHMVIPWVWLHDGSLSVYEQLFIVQC